MLPKCLLVTILLVLGAAAKSNEHDSDNLSTNGTILSKLRLKFQSAGCDAIIVTSDDEHQNEFVADSDRRIEFISGFTGSAGTVVVTATKAALWTDGRYHTQAAEELDNNWVLMRSGLANVPGMEEWIKEEHPQGAKICADPKLMPAYKWHLIEENLHVKNENWKWQLAKTKTNLVDAIWEDKPIGNTKAAFVLDTMYSGKDWHYKVNQTRRALANLNADAMVVTALDEICWLLNLRGSDIPYTPIVKSYVYLNESDVILFLEEGKVPLNFSEVFQAQGQENVRLVDYKLIWTELPNYVNCNKKVLIPNGIAFNPGASKAIHDLVPSDKHLLRPSPIINLKAEKNPTEIDWMRKAHLQDAVALCEFFEYVEDYWSTLDELGAAKILDRLRSKLQTFVSLSFPTIAAYGNHSAQPHYIPSTKTSIKIENDGILMVDSGGQYLGGTTDVTRTISIGEPTDEQIDAYTRLLIGTIEFSSLVFPESVTTSQLDMMARAPLWELGYDFLHGTGHGIGSFSLVHESPIIIRYASKQSASLKVGHFTSIEPGMYLEGKFGARLENIVQVVEKTNLKYNTSDKYLGFETVTLFPYDAKLINFDALSKKHVLWLKKYYRQILKEVGDELKKQEKLSTYDWLKKQVCECFDELKLL